MDDWKEVVEDGQVWYIHEEHGNIIKLTEDSYVAMIPRVVKIGPFTSLDNAKSALVWKKDELEAVLEEFNSRVVK